MTPAQAETAVDLPAALSSRDRLLSGAIAYIAEHGFADVSLRELAAALGTSHRMLLYHFDSKEQLFVEIIRAFEVVQRDLIADFVADSDEPRADLQRRVWKQLSAPANVAQIRFFFQVCGQALSGGDQAAAALDGIISDWLEPIAAIERRRGTPAAVAKPRCASAWLSCEASCSTSSRRVIVAA
jgi:AcrR family transcriptional regulator